MKLRNKKTGEIGWLYCDHISVPKKMTVFSEDKDLSAKHWDYASLAELNEEWEDYKNRPYVIDMWEDDCICDAKFGVELEGIERAKECGLYFETKEEAEKAVEKLKAWKRLKDKGFRFDNWDLDADDEDVNVLLRSDSYKGNKVCAFAKDLALLFGGEE